MKCVIPSMAILCIIIGTVFLVGCAESPLPSLYDPDDQSLPQPVIDSIVPQDSALAVVYPLTINGSNFSSVEDENSVFFDALKGEILAASETQLTVKSPYLVKNSIAVKIAVFGADKFSEAVLYKLLDPAPELVAYTPTEKPNTITCDAEGNVYTSFVQVTTGQGVKKITPDGTVSDYAPKGAETYWAGMKFGPDGILYCVRNVRAVFQIPAGGGASSTWAVIPDRTVKLADIDFDADLNMWAAGNNQNIYRIKPDKDVQDFAFVAEVNSIRIFDGYVYLAGARDGESKIWRMQIVSADELGAEEEVFDFSASYTGKPLAMTFAADGDLYIGTDAPEAVVTVHPDGSHEALYAGLFEAAPVISVAWNDGEEMYITREGSDEIQQTILRVGMSKAGAPYYGRGDS